MYRLFATLLLAALLAPAGWAQVAPTCQATGTDEGRPSCTLTDASLEPGTDYQLDAGTTYILSGIVIVEDGAVLRAPAGTRFKAEAGTGTDATALVVARGGQLIASGTSVEPVIFTSIQDNLDTADFLTYQDRGLWGGIILLGYARNNNTSGISDIEGVNEILSGDPRIVYGCTGDDCNDGDSSGSLRYVSIRHTGINIGQTDGNEIQGLTLGSVGSGTELAFVESYASADDGFEFFGGTVDAKWLVAAFCSDDSFDFDRGYRGRGQYWFAIQAPDQAGALAEQDGASGSTPGNTPFATPTFYNFTLIGAGVGNQPETDRGSALYFRENFGGSYYNSVITQFETADGGFAVRIRDDLEPDSFDRFQAGDLTLGNNVWWDFGNDAAPTTDLTSLVRSDSDSARDAIVAGLGANGNTLVDPGIAGVDRAAVPSNGLDPRPLNNDSPLVTGARATPPNDGFFDNVAYLGAFGNTNWLEGWTALSDANYLGDISVVQVANEDALPQDVSVFEVYPNPFAQQATVRFGVESAQDVDVAVFDMLGRRVAQLAAGTMAAGSQEVTFEGHSLPSGVYFVRVRTEAGSAIQKVSLVK
ncbi:MAG: T9SS type A sorting domain-containing protein [Bacteroidota bacterium]